MCCLNAKTKLQNADFVLGNASICVCEKCNCFMQRDGICDYIGSIFINVTSSLENTSYVEDVLLRHEYRSSYISGYTTIIEVSRVHTTIWLYVRHGKIKCARHECLVVVGRNYFSLYREVVTCQGSRRFLYIISRVVTIRIVHLIN
jgi:hypothetical protein